MKKFYKFLKSFLFISLWLILSSFLTQYWNTFHWEYIYLNLRSLFDKEFWFVVERILLGFDIGYWLEEALKFLSYEIPKESFKYLPIYFVLKSIWIKSYFYEIYPKRYKNVVKIVNFCGVNNLFFFF